VVAAGYACLGPAVLDRLRGRFALAAWNVETDDALLAVDQLGARQLYLGEAGGRLAFATELGDLLRLLPTRPGPSREAVASWLAHGTLRPAQTLYEGIRRLPDGHLVRLRDGRWHEERYWEPKYASPVRLPREEAVEAVGAAVERAV